MCAISELSNKAKLTLGAQEWSLYMRTLFLSDSAGFNKLPLPDSKINTNPLMDAAVE